MNEGSSPEERAAFLKRFERFDCLGGRVLAARHYFETGALARATGATGA